MTNLEHDGLGVILIVPCHVACSMLGAFMMRNSDLFHPFHEKKRIDIIFEYSLCVSYIIECKNSASLSWFFRMQRPY